MSYGPIVIQNVVKDDILICRECLDTVDLDSVYGARCRFR